MSTIPAKPVSAPEAAESVEQQFPRLAATWHQAVAHHSSSRLRESHPIYQQIIRMGPAVVPLLLKDLETNRRHWFSALAALTGADPIPAEHAGDIPKMAEDWLRWGREHGYRW
jgi:hypothetical protein